MAAKTIVFAALFILFHILETLNSRIIYFSHLFNRQKKAITSAENIVRILFFSVISIVFLTSLRAVLHGNVKLFTRE
jgi:uncharacterized protein (DUF488 family)